MTEDESRSQVSEVLEDTLSDICHDEVLIQLVKDLDPSLDQAVSALRFLSNFFKVSSKLADFYGELDNYPDLKAKAPYFRKMTPSSMEDRTQCRIIEFRNAQSSGSFMLKRAEFVAGIAQEANSIFENGARMRAWHR